MYALTIERGFGLEEIHPLREGTTKLGRSSANHIVLEGKLVSRFHAEIQRNGHRLTLIDLDSSNGSFVNGVRVGERRLRVGDEIRLGEITMRLRKTQAPPCEERGTEPPRDLMASPSVMVTDVEQDLPLKIEEKISRDEVETLLDTETAFTPETSEQIRRALVAVYEMSSIISTTFEVDELLEKLCHVVLRSIAADSAYVLLSDPRRERFEIQAARHRSGKEVPSPPPISKTIVREVVRCGEAIMTHDAMHDQRFQRGKSVAYYRLHSVLCVPLRSRNKILGVLYVDSQGHEVFTKDDLRLLTVIGNEAGVAIENVRLIEASIQKERLAAIGETIAGMAHYIKNVLAGMRGGGDLLQLGLDTHDEHQIRVGWKIIQNTLETVSDLVFNMLDYSKERKPQFQPCHVNEIVERTLALMAGRFKTSPLRLVRNLADDLPLVALDPPAIERALLNLLTNAIDAIDEEEGGTITVSTARSDDGKYVEIAVADTGCGIEESEIPRIFDLFMSTKGGKGTGIGLAVSHKIVQEHHGEI
ncbi:MAG: FHA domain-containing protein, partial [Deltaproteobacteria bacterium]